MGIIRRTKSVEALLTEFNKTSGAISAKELIERLHSKVNKTTVYRVLDKLEDDGVLHSFLGRNGLKFYAKCTGCSISEHVDAHPHFECLFCGEIDCLNLDVVLPKIPNREVMVFQTLIQGKCEKCLAN